MTEAQRVLWAEHRQALRDLPALLEAAVDAGQPAESVPFPVAPEISAPASDFGEQQLLTNEQLAQQ